MENSRGGGGMMLFGVKIGGGGGEEEEPMWADEVMKKSWSTGNLASCGAAVAVAEEEKNCQVEIGYHSDGEGELERSRRKRGAGRGHVRKRGVPWTHEEHKTFLIGLENLGKGDWRGISKNYVTTRTPTQVASHAQKYFLRQTNPNKKKRRSSLFDLAINDNAAKPVTNPALPLKEAYAIPEENNLSFQNFNQAVPQVFSSSLQKSHGLQSSPAFPPPTRYHNAFHLHDVNAMAGSMGIIKGQEVKSNDTQAVSLDLTVSDSNGKSSSDFATFSPGFLKFCVNSSPKHRPQFSAQISTPPTPQSSDLELRIAPPLPHYGTKFSSPKAVGAIRVV